MFFKKIQAKFKAWYERHAGGKNAKWWLFWISFSESSFFPIPTDPFMVAVLLVQRAKWFSITMIVTISSVLGGMLGYLIGFAFFALIGEPLVDFYGLQEEVTKVGELFSDNAFLAVFTGAFTPIPYKIFTISAGLFNISFLTFIMASVVGRFIRYFIIGYIMKLFGEKIGEVVFKYFNIASLAAVIVIGLYILHSLAF